MSGSLSAAVAQLENQGFNGAAASYILTALTDAAAASAYHAAAGAATGRGTDSEGNSAPRDILTNYAGGISRLDIPASVAAAVSSIYLQAEAFQTGGTGAVLPAQTAGVSSQTANVRVVSSTMNTQSSTPASTSKSGSTSTSGASSQSITSSSTGQSSQGVMAANATGTATSITSSTGVLTASTESPTPAASSGLSSGTTAAIVVPVVVGVLLIIMGLYTFWRRRAGLGMVPFKGRPHRESSAWFCQGNPELGPPRTEVVSFLDQPARMAEYRGKPEPQAWL